MNELKQAVVSLPLVKRVQEIERYIDSNLELKKNIDALKELQKKMVHAKEFQQPKQYQVYKKEYDELYQMILDQPFVEEYLDLLEEANSILGEITGLIESKINTKLKE